MNLDFKKLPWIESQLESPVGKIPVVRTDLLFSDRLGHWKVRWGMNRMTFRIQPGLYAVGSPDSSSPVFVSANYKLSFDMLRMNLKGVNGWILVLDTKGVNVWCAAGKGTFGTDEIIRQIDNTKLREVVSHRRLIIPQLGAPGVAGHIVKEKTEFKIIYGPVRTKDIQEFMNNKMRASVKMRRIRFTLWDRLVLVPADLVGYFKYFLILSIIAILISGFGEGIYSFANLGKIGITDIAIILSIYVSITTLSQVLLPWLPGRSFSLKGLWLGMIISAVIVVYKYNPTAGFSVFFGLIGISLVIIAVSSFITMNFTGSSTFTSLSGVRKEMKIAVPLQIITISLGAVIYLTSRFV